MRSLSLALMAALLGGCDAASVIAPVASSASEPASITAAASPAAATPTPILLCRFGEAPSEPLYIVNGRIVSGEAFRRIDRSTIDSVEVVKGTAASNLYGSRASLGVLIVYTRAERLSAAR
jgi:hypothetical protein